MILVNAITRHSLHIVIHIAHTYVHVKAAKRRAPFFALLNLLVWSVAVPFITCKQCSNNNYISGHSSLSLALATKTTPVVLCCLLH